jgi:hypothetical protein
MSESEKETLGKTINTWVQTIGIIIAGVWGIYTFIYKEIWVPKTAPVNVSLDLSLQKLNQRSIAGKTSMVPIGVAVTARNPSTREVFLLPTAWVAYGIAISSQKQESLGEGEIISSTTPQFFVDMYAKTTYRVLVGVGRLFPDISLEPSETATRRLILFVPAETYDEIDVQVVVPTTTRPGKIDLAWNLTKRDTLTPLVYPIGPDGKRLTTKGSEITRTLDDEFELQAVTTSSQVSLW